MPPDLNERIRRLARITVCPDATRRPVISVKDMGGLAAETGIAGKELAVRALEIDIIPERYVRNMNTLSPADQVRLLKSHAAVIGLGGLGGTVTEVLARAGIGTLTLIDHDSFEEHNLNRQIMSSEANLGESKADVAMRRVQSIDHFLDVHVRGEYLSEDNAQILVQGADVIVDCLDSIPARFVLQRTAGKTGRPFVSAAVAGMSAHVMTIFPGDPGLETIYGDPQDAPEKGIETVIGTLPQTAIMTASIEGSEVIKILLDKGKPLRNGILMIDLQENSFELMRLGG